jgi:hypothetical protein
LTGVAGAKLRGACNCSITGGGKATLTRTGESRHYRRNGKNQKQACIAHGILHLECVPTPESYESQAPVQRSAFSRIVGPVKGCLRALLVVAGGSIGLSNGDFLRRRTLPSWAATLTNGDGSTDPVGSSFLLLTDASFATPPAPLPTARICVAFHGSGLGTGRGRGGQEFVAAGRARYC